MRTVNVIALCHAIGIVLALTVAVTANTYGVWATAGILSTFLLLASVPVGLFLLGVGKVQHMDNVAASVDRAAASSPFAGPAVLLVLAGTILILVFLVGTFWQMP